MGARLQFMRSRFNTVTSFGRVISVRGSLARVGLLASGPMPVAEVRATVGRFISIRCAGSTIIAMITEVSCEDLLANDAYIASASVDLLGEISGGERPKFQRGVTNYPTIGPEISFGIFGSNAGAGWSGIPGGSGPYRYNDYTSEIALYDLAKNDLAWTGTVRAKEPSNVQTATKSYVETVTKALAAQNLFPKK